MKLDQGPKHLLARVLLTVPLARRVVRRRLVDVHVNVFAARSDGDATARRPRLRAVFDAAVDVYLAGLRDGYPEARAREATHLLAYVEFYRLGWTDLLGVPPAELGDHFERYRPFYERHGVSLSRPFGEFTPDGGFPDAPRADPWPDPTFAHAEEGFDDGVYTPAEPGRTHVAAADTS